MSITGGLITHRLSSSSNLFSTQQRTTYSILTSSSNGTGAGSILRAYKFEKYRTGTNPKIYINTNKIFNLGPPIIFYFR